VPVRESSDDALSRICIGAYPQLISQAYERLLQSHVMDPLARVGRPAAIANPEGATLTSRVAWLRLGAETARISSSACNDYRVCTLLDSALKPFASIGTRTAGNSRQELTLISSDCPSELIAVLMHHVRVGDGASADAMPFRIENEKGEPLVSLDETAESVDAVASVEAMQPEQYFADAVAALGEAPRNPGAVAVNHAVLKSLSAIAEHANESGKGWTMIDHRVREWTPLCRAAAVHEGHFSTEPHDVLVLATRRDAAGEALDGQRTYRIRFERWSEPPANASWFLFVSPAASGRVELVREQPAMNITIGPAPPKDGRQNWIETLPGDAPLEVRLILCWPSERARSEIWTPPDIIALD